MKEICVLMILILIVCVVYLSCYNVETYLPNITFITDPILNQNDKFMLKTLDGQYVSVCKGCKPDANIKNLCSSLVCLNRYPTKNSVFIYHTFEDGRFAIETNEFKFLKHCDNCVHECRGAICGDGVNKNLTTHKWHLIKWGDGTVSIKSNTERMVQRCNCGQTCGTILCTMGVGVTEKFIVEKIVDEPRKEIELKFKPKIGRSSLFDGVSLSNVV